jgi:hypothetical protein
VGTLYCTGFSRQADSQRYLPHEWESVTVTRFARSIIPGSRYVGIGTTGGLLVYDRMHQRWHTLLTKADGLPDNSIDRVELESGGGFAILARGWTALFEPASRRLLYDPFLRPAARSGDVQLPANLYAGPDYQYFSDGRIAGPDGWAVPVMDAAGDDDAGLWLATWGLGSGRADLYSQRLRMEPHGLWHSDVRALDVKDGVLVAGGFGDAWASGGITELRLRDQQWKYLLAPDTPGLISDRVSGLALDGNTLWVAAEGSVSRRSGNGRWRSWMPADGLPDGRTIAIAVGSGAAWVGTIDGAVAVAGDSLTVLSPFIDREVRDIAVGGGAVWWATDSGAHVYRGRWQSGRFLRIDHPEGRLDGQIDAVGTYKSEVWWASASGIVAYDSEVGEWIDVPVAGPFSPGQVTDLAAEEANVWVASTTGVWRFIRERQEWFHYDESDGLIDRRVWSVATADDVVWFGTAGGLTKFDWSLRKRAP